MYRFPEVTSVTEWGYAAGKHSTVPKVFGAVLDPIISCPPSYSEGSFRCIIILSFRFIGASIPK